MIPPLTIPAIAELAGWRRWVCWELQERGGKQTKVPLTPAGTHASSTNSSTWSSFADCVKAYVGNIGNGLGFMFTDTSYVGIDLDHCVANGSIRPDAHAIVRRMASYTEFSPSGDGLHIIVRGSLPPGGRRRGWIEAYDSLRYFTVTGRVVDDFDTIESRPELLAEFHAKHLAGSTARESACTEERQYPDLPYEGLPSSVRLLSEWSGSVRARLERAHTELDRFRDRSESEVDLGLASLLAREGCAGHEIEAAIRWRRESLGCPKRPGYYIRTANLALVERRA